MAGQKTDERDVQIGRRLAEQRKRAGLTQRAVAERFGMSAAQLQKYEKGTNRISAVHVAILSRLTGTPVADFFTGIPQIDDVQQKGFAEAEQDRFSDADPWLGLASVVVRHVSNHFDEPNRKEFAAVVDVLSRKLGS